MLDAGARPRRPAERRCTGVGARPADPIDAVTARVVNDAAQVADHTAVLKLKERIIRTEAGDTQLSETRSSTP